MSAIMMVHNNNIIPPTVVSGPSLVTTGVSVVASSPFSGGGNSYSFAGTTSSYVYYSGYGSALAFGTGDYTIEWWEYDLGSSSFPRIFWYTATAGSNSPSMGMSQEGSAGARSCYLWTPTPTSLASTAISINTWYHFALVRISGRVYLYKNGTVLNTGGTVNTVNHTDTTSKWYIGSKSAGGLASEQFYGYITNFRVCKGVGVYTGNFTVPTSALQTTQSSGTNISAITAGQCTFLLQP
jgi:hypothetical protein